MKKIIVFGATGGTWLQITNQLLERGYEVTIILRNPSALNLQHQNLKVSRGDVLQPDSFAEAIKDMDVVISTLGTGKNLGPTKIYSEGVNNIMSEMSKNNIKRIICISSGALYTNSKMGFLIRLLTKVVLHRVLKEIYSDMRIMESNIQKTNFNYTIFRPPMLKDKPLKGKYRVAINDNLKMPFSIGRADLAHCIIEFISNTNSYKSFVEISY